MSKARTSLFMAATTGALVAAGLMAAPTATAAPKRHTLAHSTPSWVARAKSLGRPSSGAKTSVRVYLAPNGGVDALQAAVARVSDPKSSSYRHFLSAKQFHAKYDATSATVSKVSGYLRDHNLSVSSVEPHNRYIAVSGSNADIQSAFGVTLAKFRHHGQIVQANTDGVTLPTDIASSVVSVAGLDTTPRIVKHDAPPPAGFRNGRPCSRYYGQVAAKYQADYKTPLPAFKGATLPYAVCGYTGPQFRSAYENNSALTGDGVTVGIIDAFASPTIATDTNRYASDHGDGSYGPGQLSQVVPTSFKHQGTGPNGCGASGWYPEESLDIEAVHAMAPDADITYYGGVSCYDSDLLDTQTQVVDQNAVDIVTNSYGEPESEVDPTLVAPEHDVFLQAAMQGMSFMFSSGDDGDELANTGTKQADASASDPDVTAVGGTADAIGPNAKFEFQTGWGIDKYTLSGNGQSWQPNGFLAGAGGGSSSLYNKPAYQDGVVPGSYGAGRQVPDVAMDADSTTGMLIGLTQKFSDGKYYDEFRVGGTSLASPLFAGMTALASQHAGGRLGFLNPALYSQAGSPVFNDIKGSPPDAGNVRVDFVNGEDASDGLTYSVRTFNQDSSLAVRRGWDNVTGVGSPNASWLTSLSK
jgi:subtilase family serine protease